MNLRLTVLGYELLAFTTQDPPAAPLPPPDQEREWAEWRVRSAATGGDFGFGRTDLTAIEHPDHRWETERTDPDGVK